MVIILDKELKENIEKLAQAERLADEEKMATDSIIGAIEVSEDIEDKIIVSIYMFF